MGSSVLREIEIVKTKAVNDECLKCHYYIRTKDKCEGRFNPLVPCVIFKEVCTKQTTIKSMT